MQTYKYLPKLLKLHLELNTFLFINRNNPLFPKQ